MRYAIDNRPRKKMLLHHPTSTRDFWKSSLCTRFPPRHDYLPFFSPNKHRTGSGSLEIQIYTCKQHFSCLILVRSINFVKGRRRKEIKKNIFECHLIWQRWITFGCARQQPEDERVKAKNVRCRFVVEHWNRNRLNTLLSIAHCACAAIEVARAF